MTVTLGIVGGGDVMYDTPPTQEVFEVVGRELSTSVGTEAHWDSQITEEVTEEFDCVGSSGIVAT